MDVVRVDDGSLVSLVLDQEREEEERYFQEDLINEVLGHCQNVLAIQISSLEEMTGGVYLMRWRFRRVCWMSSMVKEVCYEVNSRENHMLWRYPQWKWTGHSVGREFAQFLEMKSRPRVPYHVSRRRCRTSDPDRREASPGCRPTYRKRKELWILCVRSWRDCKRNQWENGQFPFSMESLLQMESYLILREGEDTSEIVA